MDSPLSEKGLRQAELTGQALAPRKVDRSFSSDAGRAVATAKAIRRAAPGLPPFAADARLRELRYGRWEGMLHEEIKAQFPQEYAIYKTQPQNFRAPDGESFGDLRNRVSSFLAELTGIENQTCLVVSHAGVVRAAIGLLLRIPLEQMWSTPGVPEAGICVIAYAKGRWLLTEEPNSRHLGSLNGENE